MIVSSPPVNSRLSSKVQALCGILLTAAAVVLAVPDAHAEFVVKYKTLPPAPVVQPAPAASPAPAPAATPEAPVAKAPVEKGRDLTVTGFDVPKGAAAPVAKPEAEKVVASSKVEEKPEVIAMAPVVQEWVISPTDGSLRVVLGKWSARAGWQLHWDAQVDVPITVSAVVRGDFREAVKSIFGSLSAADVNLSALMYSGNRVLRVTEFGQRAQ